MHLGIARTRSGDEHGGASDLEGALATFEQLGARVDAARIEELLGRSSRAHLPLHGHRRLHRLLETLGDEKWRRLLGRHDDLVRSSIAEGGGEVVKHTGDGFFTSFESAKGAVEAAVAIRGAPAEEIVTPDVRIRDPLGEAFRTGNDGRLAARACTWPRPSAPPRPRGRCWPAPRRSTGWASFRLSSARPETLKGVPAARDVVAVDWR